MPRGPLHTRTREKHSTFPPTNPKVYFLDTSLFQHARVAHTVERIDSERTQLSLGLVTLKWNHYTKKTSNNHLLECKVRVHDHDNLSLYPEDNFKSHRLFFFISRWQCERERERGHGLLRATVTCRGSVTYPDGYSPREQRIMPRIFHGCWSFWLMACTEYIILGWGISCGSSAPFRLCFPCWLFFSLK